MAATPYVSHGGGAVASRPSTAEAAARAPLAAIPAAFSLPPADSVGDSRRRTAAATSSPPPPDPDTARGGLLPSPSRLPRAALPLRRELLEVRATISAEAGGGVSASDVSSLDEETAEGGLGGMDSSRWRGSTRDIGADQEGESRSRSGLGAQLTPMSWRVLSMTEDGGRSAPGAEGGGGSVNSDDHPSAGLDVAGANGTCPFEDAWAAADVYSVCSLGDHSDDEAGVDAPCTGRDRSHSESAAGFAVGQGDDAHSFASALVRFGDNGAARDAEDLQAASAELGLDTLLWFLTHRSLGMVHPLLPGTSDGRFIDGEERILDTNLYALQPHAGTLLGASPVRFRADLSVRARFSSLPFSWPLVAHPSHFAAPHLVSSPA